MKIYIRAMSEQKSRLHDQLSPLAGKLIEHLMKCFMFPDCESANHWKGEIYGFVHTVPKLTNTKKWPDKKFLLDCLWSTYQDAIDPWYYNLISDYSNYALNENSELDTVYRLCYAYIEWLCNKLSLDGRVSNSQCYDRINSLIEENL